jgi:hypothetical protein
MLTDNSLKNISHEYLNGGVTNFHPEINLFERKALLKYLFSLTVCPCDKCHIG